MRLVTWNCNGAFRNKLEAIDQLDADVLVIQECEDPAQSTEAYKAWAGDFVWRGYGKNKGLGIFSRRGLTLERLAWPDDGVELFLPVRIGGKLTVLGVWTQESHDRADSYLGQFAQYFERQRASLGSDALLCGDFNSSVIWDKPKDRWRHAAVVETMAEQGYVSLYHHATGEAQGQETQPTFFLYRKPERPYHIDYVFVPAALSGSATITVGAPADWIVLSDHLPLVVDLKFKSQDRNS